MILESIWIDFEAQQAFQKDPKWSPKQTKIEDKLKHKTRRLSRPSWNRLGPVLVGSFGGRSWGQQSSKFICYIKVSCTSRSKNDNAWKGISDGSWTIFYAKEVQKGSQFGPKMEPTLYLKALEKSDRFGIALKTT